MVCKILHCSEFPDIPEKSWRRKRRRWRKRAHAKRFAFQVNTLSTFVADILFNQNEKILVNQNEKNQCFVQY